MITNRLELALDRLRSPDWERFERLASAFLAAEYDELRTVAAPSGDGGRDSELFSPFSEPTIVAQYSVTSDWRGKILSTVKRLGGTFPNVLILVYVSSKTIGAAADDLKKTLRTKHGISLDVRDRAWFCERVLESTSRQVAAEELAKAVVDPYLSDAGVGPRVQADLNSQEAVAAVTFLGLQWHDDVRDKGLTRIAFEALVRSALLDTSSERRITRDELNQRVCRLLPGHGARSVSMTLRHPGSLNQCH